MAEQAGESDKPDSFGAKWVCCKCLEDNPRNKSLLNAHCMDRSGAHERFPETLVWWRAKKNHLEIYDETAPGRVPKVRPVPAAFGNMKFKLCDPSRCLGERCTHAHSIEEREMWNSKRFQPKYVQKVRMLSPAKLPREEKRLREDHESQSYRKSPSSKSNQVHANIKVQEQVLNEELTSENYQRKFLALLTCEQHAHIQELEKRCNRLYKLVIVHRQDDYGSRQSYLYGYLDDVDGDQIAYCTQASDGINLQYRGRDYHATILRKNFHRTDNRLYVDVDTRGASLGKEVEVSATFELKVSYFARLQSSVTHLSENAAIVKRLLPTGEDFQPYLRISVSSQSRSVLNLGLCSADQLEALTAAISSPAGGPPFLITGPFGSGKTRIVALLSHFFFHQHQEGGCTRILVCTQQHVSADTFLDCYDDLAERKDSSLQIVRLVPSYYRNLEESNRITTLNDLQHMKNNLLHNNKVLIITTCSTAFSLSKFKHLPSGYFTHILIDEAAQVREPEAVGPLCFATTNTKIILAGDQHQVGPALLVLGEQAQEHGLAVSLLERLHQLYTMEIGGEALHYHRALTTSHRCAREILKLGEKLFYKTTLTPSLESHPNAPFPFHFVCSDVENKLKPLVTDTSYPKEADVVVEQIRIWSAQWTKNVWGKKDFTEIAIASPTRSQLHVIQTKLRKEFEDKYQDVQKSPTYDIQGRDYRIVIVSTSEPTNADGSARDRTKSICNPFVFNTVISRARSLIVCVGNPYVLLRKEQHMVGQYGEKAKCWSNFLKLCIDNKTFRVGDLGPGTSEEEVKWMRSPLPSIVDYFVGAPNPEDLLDMKG